MLNTNRKNIECGNFPWYNSHQVAIIGFNFAGGYVLSRKGEAVAEYCHYYVNNNPHVITGVHEVHKNTCLSLAMAESKSYLGHFADCRDAIAKARTIYTRVDKCPFCCPEINSLRIKGKKTKE